MKRESFHNLSDDDLLLRRAEHMRELTVSQFQLYTGQLEDNSRIGKLRKEIARLNTELRTREIRNGMSKGALLSRAVSLPSEQAAAETTETAAPAKRSRFGLGFIRDTLLGRRS